MYKRNRVLSGLLEATVIGAQNTAAGWMQQSIALDTPTAGAGTGTAITQYARFGNLNLIQDGFFNKSTAATPGATIASKYFIIDSAASDFKETSQTLIGNNTPFLIAGYIDGTEASTPAVRLQWILHVEATLDNEYTDYVSTSCYVGADDELSRSRKAVQNMISRSTDDINYYDNKKFSLFKPNVIAQASQVISESSDRAIISIPDGPNCQRANAKRAKIISVALKEKLLQQYVKKSNKKAIAVVDKINEQYNSQRGGDLVSSLETDAEMIDNYSNDDGSLTSLVESNM